MRAAAALWLLAALPALTGHVWWRAAGEVVTVSGAGAGAGAGVSFAARQHTAVLAAAGHSAALHCAVLHLGDKAVSWVRSRDLQILTHAGAVFTADARVSAAETATADSGADSGTTHALRIERLRAEDSGRYECQVNTEPKLSLFFNLTVLDEPMPTVVVTALKGHVVRGSERGAATLACSARYSPAPRALPLPPLAVLWRRLPPGAPLSLSPQGGRGGVSLDTERWGGARLESRLTLAGLRADDAGRYQCTARALSSHEGQGEEPTEVSDTLTLIVDGEDSHVEAMQRDQSALSGTHTSHPPRCLAALALLLATLAR